MADRVTQLQDAVNELADHFCNSIGILQQRAQPSDFGPQASVPATDTNEDNGQLFSRLIVKTSQDIITLIDSLPVNISETENSPQIESIVKLNKENYELGLELANLVDQVEVTLEELRSVIVKIGEARLKASGCLE